MAHASTTSEVDNLDSLKWNTVDSDFGEINFNCMPLICDHNQFEKYHQRMSKLEEQRKELTD